MSKYKFIISGGGTGGHIYPAIAIANELKERYPESTFLFVGAKDKMEMEKVPQAGFEIEGLWISGIQRKLTAKNLLFPFKLIASLLRARKILKKFEPDAVVGTGGFASGPVLNMATRYKIPCLIQEQNSFPGITNKLLAKSVQKVCVAYDDLERFFPKDKIVKTGNPVRERILNLPENQIESKNSFKLRHNKITLLVLGGSLGSRRINQLIDEKLEFFETQNVEVIWQCGKLYYQQYYRNNQRKGVQVHAFLNEMEVAYSAADIVISRAGASSVSELCVVGKPVIFIPSPNVAEDHQTKNAQAIVNDGGALMIKETELDVNFENLFSQLINSKERQESLSTQIKSLALPNATSAIVDEIEKLLEG